MAKRTSSGGSKRQVCSFCGRSKKQVDAFVEGPGGVFICPDLYVLEDIGFGKKRLDRTRNDIFFKQSVSWDSKNEIICVKKNLVWNPLINPNQVLSARRILKMLPNSYIFKDELEWDFHMDIRWLRN